MSFRIRPAQNLKLPTQNMEPNSKDYMVLW
jgi:hypothetical protein